MRGCFLPVVTRTMELPQAYGVVAILNLNWTIKIIEGKRSDRTAQHYGAVFGDGLDKRGWV